MTVTTVKVGGQTLKKDEDYTLTNDSSSQVKVHFTTAPGDGVSVEISGTCTNDNHGPHSGGITWS